MYGLHGMWHGASGMGYRLWAIAIGYRVWAMGYGVYGTVGEGRELGYGLWGVRYGIWHYTALGYGAQLHAARPPWVCAWCESGTGVSFPCPKTWPALPEAA